MDKQLEKYQKRVDKFTDSFRKVLDQKAPVYINEFKGYVKDLNRFSKARAFAFVDFACDYCIAKSALHDSIESGIPDLLLVYQNDYKYLEWREEFEQLLQFMEVTDQKLFSDNPRKLTEDKSKPRIAFWDLQYYKHKLALEAVENVDNDERITRQIIIDKAYNLKDQGYKVEQMFNLVCEWLEKKNYTPERVKKQFNFSLKDPDSFNRWLNKQYKND